jgi:uncharacterized membrane protein YfcA
VPGNALLVVIGVTLLVFGIDLLRPKTGGRHDGSGRVSARAAIFTGALIGLLGGFVGLILGARLTGRLDESQLLRAIGLVLLVAGTAMIVQGLV